LTQEGEKDEQDYWQREFRVSGTSLVQGATIGDARTVVEKL
jgi:hypothetical protein